MKTIATPRHPQQDRRSPSRSPSNPRVTKLPVRTRSATQKDLQRLQAGTAAHALPIPNEAASKASYAEAVRAGIQELTALGDLGSNERNEHAGKLLRELEARLAGVERLH